MSFIFDRGGWEDFAERAIGTFGQAFIGALPVTFAADINWINALHVALFATLVFSIKGIIAGTANSETGASFGTSVPRETVRTIVDEGSPTENSAEEGSDLETGTSVLPEEPYSK